MMGGDAMLSVGTRSAMIAYELSGPPVVPPYDVPPDTAPVPGNVRVGKGAGIGGLTGASGAGAAIGTAGSATRGLSLAPPAVLSSVARRADLGSWALPIPAGSVDAR